MTGDTDEGALTALITRAAVGAAIGAVLLLALGLLAELLRRRHRARRVLALLDLTVPTGVRTAIVSVLALLATFTGARPIGADDSLRGWLGQRSSTTAASPAAPAPTSTSTPSRPVFAAPPVMTPAPTGPVPAPVAPTTTTIPLGPVVLIPPVTITRPAADPAPTTSTTAPPRKRETPRQPATTVTPPKLTSPSGPPAPTVVAPPASAPGNAPEVYVVQRDDCLWSIAARRLGSGADGRTIDHAWRQIYAANRASIGDDPNLIHIGLTLALPPLTPAP